MKKQTLIITSCFMICLASCSSTKIASSWKEPGKQVDLSKLNKVLVVAMLKNEVNSQNAEDQMASYLQGKGVVSYHYLGNGVNKKDKVALHEKMKADGFDAAITMRLVDVDKDITYRPGSSFSSYPDYYRNFDGYYSRSWEIYSTPGEYLTTQTYTVETNVFSIKEDKIIWTSLTKSTNPDGVMRMTAEIAKVIYKAMKKEGFVKN